MHEVPNKRISDKAMGCSPEDQVEATQGLHNFLQEFNVESMSVDEIANLHFDRKSLKIFQTMTFIEPGESIPMECMHDFLTTVCLHLAVHKPFFCSSKQVHERFQANTHFLRL
jgi:hypothetical protein